MDAWPSRASVMILPFHLISPPCLKIITAIIFQAGMDYTARVSM